MAGFESKLFLHMLGIFLDIETTGLDSTRHCPIDIAFKIIDLSTGNVKGSYQSVVKQSWEKWEMRDPASIKINGFTWEDIIQGKEIGVIREEIVAMFSQHKIQRGGAAFICQNPAFDRAFFNQLIQVYKQEQLNWPYHWLDLASMYWAMYVNQMRQSGNPLPEKISLSKNDIARHYQLPVEGHPHKAMKGVEHLIACYQAVLKFDFSRGEP